MNDPSFAISTGVIPRGQIHRKHPIITSMVKKSKKTNLINEALGKAIRETRLKIPISQEELAYQAGLDRSYMGAVERGEYNLTIKNIARVAIALDVKPSYLVKIAEEYWTGKVPEDSK